MRIFPFVNLIFDAKYLCEGKCYSINPRPAFPEMKKAKVC
ncbi:hypothetical protein T07_12690 [Trichinella nelsoni]|uniref:Uncharacterized protein n=1 Tax=Trichinella nelsoni TaxID=6336 RepID=A0A0V0RBE3_9BILA|nr:hypothetical protein T07_12690 [Trichinella nelsoni]